MFEQMITIAGGILLAIFILVNLRIIANTILVLAGAFAVFILYLRSADEPSYLVPLPSKETFGAIFSILLLIGLVFVIYGCYKGFMKGWHGEE